MKNFYLSLTIFTALVITVEAKSTNPDTTRTYNNLKAQAKENYVSAIARAINTYDSVLKDEAAIQACIGIKVDSDLATLGTCKTELVRVLQANPGKGNDNTTESKDTIADLNTFEMTANMSLDSFTNKSEPEKENMEKVVKNPLYGKKIPGVREALTPENKRKSLEKIKDMGSQKDLPKAKGSQKGLVSRFVKGSSKGR